MNRMPFPG
uniref:TIDP3612 n=1 Tax=Arundo donax TaxID=35708 RepID=A0A0A9FGT5_ARUDO